MVAPPTKKAVYEVLATRDGSSAVTSYSPGEQLTLILSVVGSKADKFLGLLMYAYTDTNTQVGTFVLPPGTDSKFWLPADCNGAAVTHRDASIKPYTNKFQWRAPAAGTGTVTFRVLIKWGETNGGAFFWPSRDVALTEGSVASTQWVKSDAGQSCNEACQALDETCDGQSMVDELGRAVSAQYTEPLKGVVCRPPYLSRDGGTSDAHCLFSRGLAANADGHCWYRTDSRCMPVATADAGCTDLEPPSGWRNPTCATQVMNTDNCAQRRAGTMTDGYCYASCGVCTMGVCQERVSGEHKICACTTSNIPTAPPTTSTTRGAVLARASMSTGPWCGVAFAAAGLVQLLARPP